MNLAKVEPKPNFTYFTIEYEEKSFGIIEIPVDKNGPYLATRDLHTIRAHRVYFRNGTVNDEADHTERKNIYNWFHGIGSSSSANETNKGNFQTNPSWDIFYRACHNFDPSRLYAFVVGDNLKGNSNWSVLGQLSFSLALDFDIQTEKEGVFFYVSPTLKNIRSVHLLTFDEKYSLAPEAACYWYAAKGLDGRSNSLIEGDWRTWNCKYGVHVQNLISSLAKASGGKPITIINLWYAPEYAREICSIFDRYFGDYAEFVFAMPDAERLNDLSSQFAAKTISIDISSILIGISKNFRNVNQEFLLSTGLPRSDNGFYLIEPQDMRWLSEDLEIIHSNIELEPPSENREAGRELLKRGQYRMERSRFTL